jgi:hypothetical protein
MPYTLLCALLGLVLGQIPRFLHGPIPEKYDVLYIKGAIAVWAWYVARSLIGFLVGITVWPPQWWLRGPLCGVLLVGPLCFMSLATPGCGAPCAGWNLTSAVTIGTVVAGVGFLVTGKHHR